MKVIGLTGGIACGKSTISQELRNLGCAVIDADQLSRALTAPGGAALPLIRSTFGDAVFQADGSLNRAALGKLVFSDDAERARLDGLMAPLLLSATQEALDRCRGESRDLCFLDCPLLYEKGYDRFCDSVWCVWLPEEIQLTRLMNRDGYTREEALSRIHSVLSSDEKAARADVVLDNSGPMEYTLSLLPDLLEKERAKIAPRRRRSERYAAEQGAGRSTSATGTSASGIPASINFSSAAPGSPASGASAPMASPAPTSHRTPEAEKISIPDVMDRPAAARKQPSRRKAAWKMPAWLMTVLIVCAAALAVSFTAQCLMRAYLVQRAAEHEAEQAAIDRNYPLLYTDLIRQYAAEYNLNPAYVAAIIRNESSFQEDAVSRVGARGLMQLMPDTAEWIAKKLKVESYSFERMYDPASNIRFGCWYLNYLSSLFRGDPVCVTCAYHAGQGEIASWLSDKTISDDGVTMSVDRLPEGPTKTYAGRVTRDYAIYQEKYFMPDSPADAAVADGES